MWDTAMDLAEFLSFKDFVSLKLIFIQDGFCISNVWFDNDVMLVSAYDRMTCGFNALFVILKDSNLQTIDDLLYNTKYADQFDYYETNGYDNIDNKAGLIMTAYNTDFLALPSYLWNLKIEIDNHLYPSESDYIKNLSINWNISEEYTDEEIYSFILLYTICRDEYIPEYFESTIKYKYPRYIRVYGIDNYRGSYEEQKMIADVIEDIINLDKELIINMWAFDSGFEVLKDRLGSYIECGKISLLLKSENNC